MPMHGPGGIDNPCPICDGTGEIGGEFHVQCLGTGLRAELGLNTFLKEFHTDVMDKLADLKEKVDEIHDIVSP